MLRCQRAHAAWLARRAARTRSACMTSRGISSAGTSPVRSYACMHACMQVCACARACLRVRVWVRVCLCVIMHACKDVYTYLYLNHRPNTHARRACVHKHARTHASQRTSTHACRSRHARGRPGVLRSRLGRVRARSFLLRRVRRIDARWICRPRTPWCHPIPAQMWQGRSQSDPGADVAGEIPVPAQMCQG